MIRTIPVLLFFLCGPPEPPVEVLTVEAQDVQMVEQFDKLQRALNTLEQLDVDEPVTEEPVAEEEPHDP